MAEPKKTKPRRGITAYQQAIAPSRSSIACGRTAVEQISSPGMGLPGTTLVMKAAMNSKAARMIPRRKTTSSPGSSGATRAGSSGLMRKSHRRLTRKIAHTIQKEVRGSFLPCACVHTGRSTHARALKRRA